MTGPDGERAAVACLLGRLLLLEVDRAVLQRLREPAVAAALARLGVALPAGEPDDDRLLDELAAEYHASLLAPHGDGPPIQSLHQEGRYRGDAALAVEQLARAAGLVYDPAPGRGAPCDHLGALLLLWAELADRWSAGADHLRRRHLTGSLRALSGLARAGGFYGGVARAAVALVGDLPSLADSPA